MVVVVLLVVVLVVVVRGTADKVSDGDNGV